MMKTTASDRQLIEVMRRYFAAQAELAVLKTQLEAARQTAGEAIDQFYDLRGNGKHVDDLQKMHGLKREIVSLMQRAEAWGRAQLAADPPDRAATGSTAEGLSENAAKPLFGDDDA